MDYFFKHQRNKNVSEDIFCKKRNLVRNLVSSGANPADLPQDLKEVYEQQQYFRKYNVKIHEKKRCAIKEVHREAYLQVAEIHKKYKGAVMISLLTSSRIQKTWAYGMQKKS